MDRYIPEAFIHVTKCFTSDILEDGKTVIGLCTKSGQLLEFLDKNVVDSCDIDRDVDSICTFTSYDPLQKYYIVHSQQILIIVKRNKPMSIIKTFEDVIEFKIEDRLLIGRPQVVIRVMDNLEPIVTDFVSELQLAGPRNLPFLTTNLSGKLQEMNTRIVKARLMLQEKQNARFQALYRFTPHLHPPISQVQYEPQVLAWGPPFPAECPVTNPPLQLSQPWKKVHNGKWIIGIPVFNTTSINIVDIRLRLKVELDPELRYRTHVVVFPQRSSGGAEWLEPSRHQGPLLRLQADIPGLSTAVVVGIMDEPLLKKSPVVTISGVIFYRQSSEEKGIQDVLGSNIQFRVEDLIQGNLIPFSRPQIAPDENDLITLVVTNKRWVLQVWPRHRLMSSLELGDMGLIQVGSVNCWVGPHHSITSLAGLLVMVVDQTNDSYKVHLYARDTKQALHFVHILHNHWKVEVCKGAATSVQDCIQSLRSEVQVLKRILLPSKEYTSDEWDEIRKEINHLELATDLTFISYSP